MTAVLSLLSVDNPLDLTPGQEIGELTLVKTLPERRNGYIVWECVCQCGRGAIRPSGQLRYAIRWGASPMCAECLSELRAGLRIEGRRKRKQERLRWFSEMEDLYAPTFNAAEQERLVDDMEGAGIPMRCNMAEAPTVDPSWSRGAPQRGGGGGPDFSQLYPMKLPQKAPCDLCEVAAVLGWGCVRCLSWHCAACIRGGRHCGCYAERTLQEVADEFDLSRERVRQIELSGLRKLRESRRRDRLIGFWRDEVTDEEQARLANAHRLAQWLGVMPQWAQEVLESRQGTGWRKVAAFLESTRRATRRQRDYLSFALQVAPDAKTAQRIMSDFAERHATQLAEQAADERERERRQRVERAREEREELRDAARRAERREQQESERRREVKAPEPTPSFWVHRSTPDVVGALTEARARLTWKP